MYYINYIHTIRYRAKVAIKAKCQVLNLEVSQVQKSTAEVIMTSRTQTRAWTSTWYSRGVPGRVHFGNWHLIFFLPATVLPHCQAAFVTVLTFLIACENQPSQAKGHFLFYFFFIFFSRNRKKTQTKVFFIYNMHKYLMVRCFYSASTGAKCKWCAW